MAWPAFCPIIRLTKYVSRMWHCSCGSTGSDTIMRETVLTLHLRDESSQQLKKIYISYYIHITNFQKFPYVFNS